MWLPDFLICLLLTLAQQAIFLMLCLSKHVLDFSKVFFLLSHFLLDFVPIFLNSVPIIDQKSHFFMDFVPIFDSDRLAPMDKG